MQTKQQTGINLQNIQTVHAAQYQKQNQQPIRQLYLCVWPVVKVVPAMPGPDLWGVPVSKVIPSLGPQFPSIDLRFFICKNGANCTYLSNTAERVECWLVAGPGQCWLL